ncbi:MAG: FkbM family methyltransferase [Planctomycetota bacterium]
MPTTCYAVTGRSGDEVRIYHDCRNSGGHSISAAFVEGDGSYETVPTVSLGDLLARTGLDTVDLLKCDIEGAEYDVFLNTPTEVLRRVAAVAMELHVSPAFPPERSRNLVAHLERAGFRVELGGAIPAAPVECKQSLILRARRRDASPGQGTP